MRLHMSIVQADLSSVKDWADLSARLFTDRTSEEMDRACHEFLTTKKEIGFLYRLNNIAVGYMNLSIRNDYVNGTDTSPVAFVEAVYILPEYRRQGIAKELIAYAEKFAKDNGMKQLASDCPIENTVSERFHKSCGFAERERVICFAKNV